ncbi:MAG: hypothetical protein HW387_763 [Parachlamydiales bacterium]|nr:hypothetical protein [Parachlamydiales bacterium]
MRTVNETDNLLISREVSIAMPLQIQRSNPYVNRTLACVLPLAEAGGMFSGIFLAEVGGSSNPGNTAMVVGGVGIASISLIGTMFGMLFYFGRRHNLCPVVPPTQRPHRCVILTVNYLIHLAALGGVIGGTALMMMGAYPQSDQRKMAMLAGGLTLMMLTISVWSSGFILYQSRYPDIFPHSPASGRSAMGLGHCGSR